jgi:hypothetical protein
VGVGDNRAGTLRSILVQDQGLRTGLAQLLIGASDARVLRGDFGDGCGQDIGRG